MCSIAFAIQSLLNMLKTFLAQDIKSIDPRNLSPVVAPVRDKVPNFGKAAAGYSSSRVAVVEHDYSRV